LLGSQMIHITNVSKEILQTLRTKGFKGLHFTNCRFDVLKLEDVWDEDAKEGEMTPKQYERWLRDYACFTAEPEFPYFSGHDFDSDYYEEPSFNKDKYYDDLIAWVKGHFEKNVTVDYRKGCNEFEIIRPKRVRKKVAV
jgi:hypothetical protein